MVLEQGEKLEAVLLIAEILDEVVKPIFNVEELTHLLQLFLQTY